MTKKQLIIIASFACLFFFLLVGSLLLRPTSLSPQTNVSPIPTQFVPNITPYISRITITQQNPLAGTSLRVGDSLIFSFSFSQALPEAITASILANRTGSEEEIPALIQSVTTLSEDKKTITITSTETVKAATTYIVAVLENNNTLFSTQFFSLRDDIPSVQTNNQTLQEYLPYKTPTYSLIYDTQTNRYVFHLILNQADSSSFEDQFLKAKAQAEEFIRSKNIDPNAIIIDWKHS